MEILRESAKALASATRILKKGGVVICPTDTIYGFLADATNKKAVEKIYQMKGRDAKKPLPIFVSGMTMAHQLAEIDAKQAKILKKFWPGKYTFVLKRKSGIKLYGVEKNTIALRIPDYKFLNQLQKKINRPLVQTSVNISGQESVRKIKDMEQFTQVDLVINRGALKKIKPSQIRDITQNKSMRLR